MRPITFQEQKILKLIGAGYSSKEIAGTFGISVYTVESHRKNLLTKFAARNSAELILKAIQAKILSIHNPNQHENPNSEPHENIE